MTASSPTEGIPPPPLAPQNGLPTGIPHSPHIKPNFETPIKDPSRIMTKKILHVAGFFVAFATVMSILILYIDNTSMKHRQFTLSLNKDMELNGISQDDQQLIMYLREVALFPAIEPHHKPLESQEAVPEDTDYVLKLLNNKKNGIFIEAGAYNDGRTSKTDILERQFGWKGLLIQPDPRHYFNLRRHNRARSQCILACLSPMPYPREVTLHTENEIKVNAISNTANPDWLVIRVKCFPLYSLLLAINTSNIDYLALETDGTELQVLETLPFERVNIGVIGVTLRENEGDIGTIKKFLASKKYRFMDRFNGTYIFMLNKVKI
ncbi:protein Star [Anthonomus grandis grandis]|uniref:protein Star n=1 Tax=Anthonomus grandis grandis TaxID=2921223 RepID=UPI0021663641|nr:protein Star [Anthonomus grandis grandis]